MSNKRLGHLDLLKCIGLLAVLLYHSVTYEYDYLTAPGVLFTLRYLFQALLPVGVPLFFFVNGYLLFRRELVLKRHILRTLRFWGLTILWGALDLFLIMLIEGRSWTFGDFLYYLWYWRPIGWINHLWYMGALVCIYALFPLLKPAFDKGPKLFRYFLILAAVMSFGNTLLCEIYTLIFRGSYGILDMNLFNMFNPLQGLYGYSFVYFCLGGLAWQHEEALRRIPARKRDLMALGCILLGWGIQSALGVCFSNFQGRLWDVIWNGHGTPWTFLIVLGIYLLSLHFRRDTPWVRIPAGSTLGIYFMHPVLIHLTRPWVEQVPALCTVPGNILYALALGAACLGITLLLKKIPLLGEIVR